MRADVAVNFGYDVHFERDIFGGSSNALNSSLACAGKKVRVMFFVDSGVDSCTPNLKKQITNWCERNATSVELVGEIQVVQGGEEIKNSLSILDQVGELAATLGFDRHSYVVIIGGGAVLDAVGWAASTVHRGIRQIRIPTTTLSQDDSAVGVKNGINRFGQKNFYGAFAPPSAVIIDTEFLKTLPKRELIAGLSEAFKVGIIRDQKFLNELTQSATELNAQNWETIERVVRRSAEIHLEHILSEGDAFEAGSSRPLDFGHWAAHRLEALSNYELRHGEAVAIGIAIDLQIAASLGFITELEAEGVTKALVETGFNVWHKLLDNTKDIFEGLAHFKEHLGGELTLAMPDGLGRKRDINELDFDTVVRAIEKLNGKDYACASARPT